jgi:hypothetical protein
MQPQAGKSSAFVDSIAGQFNTQEVFAGVVEDIDGCIIGAPDDVFFNTGATKRVELVAQINRRTAAGNLNSQFGRADNVAFVIQHGCTVALDA